MSKILVVDSDETTCARLRLRLEAEGHDVAIFSAVNGACESFRAGVDAVVLGLTSPGDPALTTLRALRRIDSAVPVIVVARSSEDAISALREGAHFAARAPIDVEEVALLANRALEAPRSRRVLARGAGSTNIDELLVGRTPAMSSIKETIRRLSTSPGTTVLVTGESGSGKDAVARTLHAATAPDASFVYLTPSALREPLLEVELFGIESGASPDHATHAGLLECAGCGTLFLDEISDMPPSLQAKLLRFLEGKTFRRIGATEDRTSEARVVASTSSDVHAAARNGVLRSELLYRLLVVVIEVPPLRERRTDIPLLVTHFLDAFARRLGRPRLTATPSALRSLTAHAWPGNVRELANVIEQAALLSEKDTLDVSDFSLPPPRPSRVEFRLPAGGIEFRKLEREVVEQALHLARGNQTRAASLLGMTRDQIRYRMLKFNMNFRDAAGAPAASAARPIEATFNADVRLDVAERRAG